MKMEIKEDCTSPAGKIHNELKSYRKLSRQARKKLKASKRDPESWDRCLFWLERKSRFCNGMRADGKDYCGAHLLDDTQENRKGQRVACPVDPSHTVYQQYLQAHIAICNKTKYEEEQKLLPYYRENANSGGHGALSPEIDLQDIESEEEYLAALVARVGARYRGLELSGLAPAPPPPGEEEEEGEEDPGAAAAAAARAQQVPPAFAPLAAALAARGGGWRKRRHLLQQAAIVDRLTRRGLAGPDAARGHGAAAGAAAAAAAAGAAGAAAAAAGAAGAGAAAAAAGAAAGAAAAAAGAAAAAAPPAAVVHVEMGAGRGGLGLALAATRPSVKVVLVERAGVKHKADRALRELGGGGGGGSGGGGGGGGGAAAAAGAAGREGAATAFAGRARVDLRHLRLAGLPALRPPPAAGGEGRGPAAAVVAIAKHLCGVATDLALRALAGEGGETGGERAHVYGVGIATCCHHACVWEDYVGRKTFAEMGFGKKEFDLMKKWTGLLHSSRGQKRSISPSPTPSVSNGKKQLSGVSSGTADKQQVKAKSRVVERKSSSASEIGGAGENEDDEHSEGQHSLAYAQTLVKVLNLSAEEQGVLGRRCKRLIDHGRARYLGETLGMAAPALVHYCAPSVSPENCLLLAGGASCGDGVGEGAENEVVDAETDHGMRGEEGEKGEKGGEDTVTERGC